MTLTTFGAIIGFAAEIINETKTVCKGMAEKTKYPLLKEIVENIVKEEEKNYSLMEKTRRENVTEMILEPITGFEREDYIIRLDGMNQEHDKGLTEILLLLIDRERRFFHDASTKVPLPEVAGILRKISRKKDETLKKLKEIKVG